MMKNKILLLLLPLLLNSNPIFKDLSSEEFKSLLDSQESFEATYETYLNFLENYDKDVNSLISVYAYSDIEKNLKIGADLQGVPIVIKDNIDSVGLANTAGSLAMLDNLPSNDAHIVKKLKDAGLVIVGKANLSEWANFRGNPSTSGWSSYGGQTNNPYNLEYNPCGSSSGSAAAVAEGLVPLSIGTETNGSISCPASINGVVGIKPTVGLVSRDGIIPISSTQDTAGPMARSVLEAAKVLKIISGFDDKDIATKNIPSDFDYEALTNLNEDALEGKRLGLIVSNDMSDTEMALLEKIESVIQSQGGEVLRVSFQVESNYKFEDEYYLLLYEFHEGLNNYLSSSNSKFKSLAELIRFNEENSDEVLTHFGHEIFLDSLKAIDRNKYEKSKNFVVMRARDQINNLIDNNDLDGLVGLTRNPAWKTDHENGDSRTGDGDLSFGNGGLSAVAGYPHITIPLDYVNGMPVGVSFLGKAWEEAKIINFAYDFEQKNNFFPRPTRGKN